MLIGPQTLLSLGCFALMAGGYALAHRGARETFVRLSASTLWELDHLCARVRDLHHALPQVEHVCIDLGRLPAVDTSAMTPLSYAVAHLESEGVKVSFEGISPRVAEVLHRHGLQRHAAAGESPSAAA